MSSQIFSVFFLLFVLMETTGGSVNLSIHPMDISPGLTESLTVNCSFTFDQVPKIVGIISLVLSKSVEKENQEEEYKNLVSLNIFAPEQVTEFSQIDGTVSGYFDRNGESYLCIQRTYPSMDHGGLYQCEAHVLTNTGSPEEIIQIALVTSTLPGVKLLIDKVIELQLLLDRQLDMGRNQSQNIAHMNIQLDHQKNLTNHLVTQLDRQQEIERNQSHSIDYLTLQMDRQQEIERNQSHSIDYLTLQMDRQQEIERNQSHNIDYLTLQMNRQEKIIDTLLSLTKNQSDMINEQQSQLYFVKNSMYFNVSVVFRNHVYLLSHTVWYNAAVAEQTCKDHNGYLAEIEDSTEDAFVNNFLNGLTGKDYALVSGTDDGHEGVWTYTGTDRAMPYIKWQGSEPDTPKHNCMVKHRGYQWKVYDFPCSHSYTFIYFLCEVSVQ